MEQVIFKQLEFVRNLTIQTVRDIPENSIDIIPEGFNNNIRWNLGHVYLVQEIFGFVLTDGDKQLPESYERLFGRGSKPSDWNEATPNLHELLEMLSGQPKRMQKSLKGRFDEKLKKPFTTSTGLTMNTIGELLNYTLYHEGLHYQTIKLLKRFAGKH